MGSMKLLAFILTPDSYPYDLGEEMSEVQRAAEEAGAERAVGVSQLRLEGMNPSRARKQAVIDRAGLTANGLFLLSSGFETKYSVSLWQ